MEKWYIYLLILLIAGVAGCNDEDKLSATERPEFGYFVPQGDAGYDDRIVEWKEKGNFYILYKFEELDIRWQINNWLDTNTFKYTFADPLYIGKQLDLLEKQFLDYYPQELLRKAMPVKVLLVGTLSDGTKNMRNPETVVSTDFDRFVVSWGREEIVTMTETEKTEFKSKMHLAFINRLIDKNIISIPEEFSKVSSYGDYYFDRAEAYASGFLVDYYDDPSTNQLVSMVVKSDFMYYVEVIMSNPKSYLETESTDMSSHAGILHPIKDASGKILKKYNIVIDYFKQELNLDLQAIGGE